MSRTKTISIDCTKLKDGVMSELSKGITDLIDEKFPTIKKDIAYEVSVRDKENE